MRDTYPSATDFIGTPVAPLVFISIPEWKWLIRGSAKFPARKTGISTGKVSEFLAGPTNA
jgi:hypothetical protein